MGVGRRGAAVVGVVLVLILADARERRGRRLLRARRASKTHARRPPGHLLVLAFHVLLVPQLILLRHGRRESEVVRLEAVLDPAELVDVVLGSARVTLDHGLTFEAELVSDLAATCTRVSNKTAARCRRRHCRALVGRARAVRRVDFELALCEVRVRLCKQRALDPLLCRAARLRGVVALQLLEHDCDEPRAMKDGGVLAVRTRVRHLGCSMHRMPLGRRRDDRPPNSTSGIRRVETQLLGHADLVADHSLELKRVQLGGPLGLQQTHSLCIEVIW